METILEINQTDYVYSIYLNLNDLLYIFLEDPLKLTFCFSLFVLHKIGKPYYLNHQK